MTTPKGRSVSRGEVRKASMAASRAVAVLEEIDAALVSLTAAGLATEPLTAWYTERRADALAARDQALRAMNEIMWRFHASERARVEAVGPQGVKYAAAVRTLFSALISAIVANKNLTTLCLDPSMRQADLPIGPFEGLRMPGPIDQWMAEARKAGLNG
jgi:hypothetical protein